MKKETLIKIFNDNKTTNFLLITNIGEGRGINGVSFNEYFGQVDDESTKIKGFMEECIVLEHNVDNGYWRGGTHILYIPYENIVTVDFLTEHRNRYPLKLSFKHNLKEIK